MAIVSIGRQLGSGGREIGKAIAERLAVPFYDKEILERAAEESGTDIKVLERVEEKGAKRLLIPVSEGLFAGGSVSADYSVDLNDRLFLAESKIIGEIAQSGSAVIVGRAADYVLRDNPDLFSVFIYADKDMRLDRIMQRHADMSRKEATALIRKTDKKRAAYYSFYTGRRWGDMKNYDLCVDGKLGLEKIVQIVCTAIGK